MKIRNQNRPKDFIYDFNDSKPFKRKEIVVRFILIILIALASPVLLYGSSLQYDQFIRIALISFARTALLWHGSMVIILFFTSRYSLFRETFKLLTFQTIVLGFFVWLVIKGETASMRWFTHQPLTAKDSDELLYTSLLITFLISSIYASIGFFIQWKENLLRAQASEKANLEAQYETLKAQVNPHFLFNSLNTLLSLVENNSLAAKYVENLSEFMRFVLQSREKEVVLLSEELQMARQYVFLQKSRFAEKLEVLIDVPSRFSEMIIPPLSIQMLIENAIKHNEVSKENHLIISIRIEGDQFLVVENNLREKIGAEFSTGIGLLNIRSRFKFLCGKEVEIKKENGKFKVMLPLITQVL